MTNPTAADGNLSGTQFALMKKAQDVEKAQGQAAVQLIQDAGQVAEASRGAVSASPSATETGANLDTTA